MYGQRKFDGLLFCLVGCTGLAALDSTLYNITYPPGGNSSASQDPPVKLVALEFPLG
jgi:hypothetical protein